MNKPACFANWGTRTRAESLSLVIVFLSAAIAACKPSLSADSITISTATPPLQAASGQPTLTPEPQVPYPISGIPRCPGLRDLGYVLRFEWPDIETAREKLAQYTWGYYSCETSQLELESLIHTKMIQPPYLWQEVAWVEHGDSTGSLYYHSVYQAWIYVWMLTQPDRKNSYLVVAKGDPGMPQTWDCRLRVPGFPTLLACLDCRSVQ
jgi:hypothetical protein